VQIFKIRSETLCHHTQETSSVAAGLANTVCPTRL